MAIQPSPARTWSSTSGIPAISPSRTITNNERFAYVVSGTWWTSTSTVYDERTTYPVHAGTVAVDKLKGIHWDGSRTGEKEPAVLILAGTGPNTTQGVDENGKDSGPPR